MQKKKSDCKGKFVNKSTLTMNSNAKNDDLKKNKFSHNQPHERVEKISIKNTKNNLKQNTQFQNKRRCYKPSTPPPASISNKNCSSTEQIFQTPKPKKTSIFSDHKCKIKFKSNVSDQSQLGDIKVNFKKCDSYSMNLQCEDGNNFKYMSVQNFLDLLLGNVPNEAYTVVDTRYKYEYEGGHFIGAYHLPLRKHIDELFTAISNMKKKATVIFHCEKSICRGPRAANYLNALCKKNQISNVQICVLQGGFNLFWKTYKDNKDVVEKFVYPHNFVKELGKDNALKQRQLSEKVRQSWIKWIKSDKLDHQDQEIDVLTIYSMF